MIEELEDGIDVVMTPYRFSRTFMAQSHNYYCAVCKERPGVADTSTGILQPCWVCMAKGYELHKANWFAMVLKAIGLI